MPPKSTTSKGASHLSEFLADISNRESTELSRDDLLEAYGLKNRGSACPAETRKDLQEPPAKRRKTSIDADQCNERKCKDKVTCLNYLGLDRWQSKGKYLGTRLFSYLAYTGTLRCTYHIPQKSWECCSAREKKV